MTLEKSKKESSIKLIFWLLIIVFLIIFSNMFFIDSMPGFLRDYMAVFMFVSWGIFFILGLLLVILTLKKQKPGKLKKFLLLTGISALGFPVFVVLHNFVYGFFVHFFGKGFWNKTSGDEPFFFLLAVIVCPLGFLVGTIGSIVLFIRKKEYSY